MGRSPAALRARGLGSPPGEGGACPAVSAPGSAAGPGFPCLVLTGGDLAARRWVRGAARGQRPGAGLDGRWPAGTFAVEGSAAEVHCAPAPAPVIAKSRQLEEWGEFLLLEPTSRHRGSRRCGQAVPRGRDGHADAGGQGDRPGACVFLRPPRARGFAQSGDAGRW